jgi:hypothetical protein
MPNAPGFYCCLSSDCDHQPEQVFNGGEGEYPQRKAPSPERVYIQHVVGWCPVDGWPVLDNGLTDDPDGWQHSVAHLPFEQRFGYNNNVLPESQRGNDAERLR